MKSKPTKSKLTIPDLLTEIVRSITKGSEAPLVEYDEEQRIISFRVSPQDHGRCVGKQGNVIASISRIIWLASVIQELSPIAVKLLEPNGPRKMNASLPVLFDPKWNRKAMGELVETIIESIVPTSAWIIEEKSETTATVIIRIEEYLQRALMDPPFELSLSNVLRAAGMAQGVNLNLKLEWV